MIVLEKPLSTAHREQWVRDLKRPWPSVFLHTCDRSEIYWGTGPASPETARHLFRVASGLDSPLLGENAILGQVRQAYAEAAASQDLGSGLHLLFQRALKTGKRVRGQTSLSRGAVSHALGVLDILKQENVSLRGLKVMILGVNKISQDLLRYLDKEGAGTILLGNRTLDRARDLAASTSARAFPLENLPQMLPQIQVLISATRAPHFLVREEHWPRDARERWVFDLAWPRDVAPEVEALAEVRYFGLEGVESRVRQYREARQQAVSQAETLVEEELEGYLKASERTP